MGKWKDRMDNNWSIYWRSPTGLERKSKKRYTREDAERAVKEHSKHLELMGFEVPKYRIGRWKTEGICNEKIAGEGLDIPAIDCIHIVFPCHNKGGLKQYIGRGRRVYKNKDHCEVYIYKDYVYDSDKLKRIPSISNIRIQDSQRRWFKKWGVLNIIIIKRKMKLKLKV